MCLVSSKRALCTTESCSVRVQDFLARTQQLYEMHIYTHGNAEYAVEMAKLLDPSKRFFAERIISQVSFRASATSKANEDCIP